jgi:hypothetical protein
MTLTDTEVDWFARQIVIPGIGAIGQEKLVNASIAVCGNLIAVEEATSCARAAGPKVIGDIAVETLSCIVAAGLDELDTDTASQLASRTVPLVWYTLSRSVLRGGVLQPGDDLPKQYRLEPITEEHLSRNAEHRLAACDAIGTAICLILGWPAPEPFEVDLA